MAEAHTAGGRAVRVSIVSVGSEVTSGDVLDSNARDLARLATERGARVTAHRAVPDDLAAIVDALGAAIAEADIVFVSGGLGPTMDDITRDALAVALGRRLVTDEAAAASLRARYVRLARPMPEENLRQARLPEGARLVPNPNGTAPGIAAVRDDGRRVYLLPGPPREMLPMAERLVAEALPDVHAVRRTLRVTGVGESQLDEWLSDLMGDANPSLRPYAKDLEVHLRLVARADERERAEALADAVEAEVAARLGPALYSTRDERLEEVAVAALAGAGATVAFAESLTAGLAASRMASVAGASAVLRGGVVAYSEEAKVQLLGVGADTLARHGAVSAACAAEMALGARRALDSTYAVSMTGWAGPTHADEQPVGTVYYGVAAPDGVVTVVRHHLGQREQVRHHAAQTALDLVRRRALGLNVPTGGGADEAVRGAVRPRPLASRGA